MINGRLLDSSPFDLRNAIKEKNMEERLSSGNNCFVENHHLPSDDANESELNATPGDGDCEPSPSCYDIWRIALYYIYVELSPSQVISHVEFQRKICDEHELKGRIRISSEGVNGVLSGKYQALKVYEDAISCALQEAVRQNRRELSASRADEKFTDERLNLDVKYCHMRKDLPLGKQLFDKLIVKETKNVIGLFDQSVGKYQEEKSSKSEKYRLRRERRRKEQELRRHENTKNSNLVDAEEPILSNKITCTAEDATDDNSDSVKGKSHAEQTFDMNSIRRAVMEQPLDAAKHLSATEWNERLDGVSSSGKSALLLDVRNVYEMKVGHFAHPAAPTLLTNTRKYSDLPQMLATNHDVQERDQIFMYCTGGVRCERVSMLVHKLYPDKEIFQLEGGIQRYLETCSKEQRQQPFEGDKIGNTNINPGYFMGKNFVFDPRRTDPIHFGETVGRCLVCQKPHDDYDNGHAPRDNKEARCNTCRMLILICNVCRQSYRCHGENIEDVDGEKKGKSEQSSRPLLYCDLDRCVHEGSSPDPELRITTKTN